MNALIYLKSTYLRFTKSRSGAVATEYAFLIAFIAIVAAIGMTLLGQNLSAFFNEIGLALQEMANNLPQPFNT